MPFPVDEKYIAEAETALAGKLPASYRIAMAQDNGGVVKIKKDDWFLYAIRDPSDRKRLARSSNHLVNALAKTREWSGFPENAIPIADDQSGNYLVFLQDGERIGPEIHVWNHEDPTGLALVGDDFAKLKKTAA